MIIAALHQLIALATFPGIILHEWSHKFFCERLGVSVQKVCYFRLGNPSGYVIHAPINHLGKALVVVIAPLLLNTSVSIAIFALAFKISPYTSFSLALCWFGISLAMHSFPSTHDLESLYRSAKRVGIHSPLALLSLPALWLIRALRPRDTIWPGLIFAMVILIFTAFLVKANGLTF